MKRNENKHRQPSTSRLTALLPALLLALPCCTLNAQQNTTGSSDKENINVQEYLIPKRRKAERFENKKFSEHLFYSAGAGITNLLGSGNADAALGPQASVYVGNWFTPVIGVRAGLNYGMWKSDSRPTMQLLGGSVDYLINISAFAARYRENRRFEVLGIIGASYQAGLQKGVDGAIHSYGAHIGVQGKYNILPCLSLFVEPQLALYPDRIDGRYSWRKYDLAAIAMLGITYRPAKLNNPELLQGCFSGIAVGTGSGGNLLLDTEVTLGKWIDPVNGVRLSVGNTTAFVAQNQTPGIQAEKKKELNINLSLDYLCNLSNLLLAERTDRLFSMLFVAGVGSYFPGSDTASKIVVNGRFGFQGNIRVTKHCGVWVEPRVNLYQSDEERPDGQKPLRASAGLMIGTTYNF